MPSSTVAAHATSPRRSSRARTTQPPTGSEKATPSSSASTPSARAVDRSTRSHNPHASPPKSATPRSRSPDDVGDGDDAGDGEDAGDGDDDGEVEIEAAARLTLSEQPQTRRRRREQADDEDLPLRHVSRARLEGAGDGDGDEEEVTRCVCGQLDYPGPPPSLAAEAVKVLKDEAGAEPDALAAPPEVLPDDAGGLFIQCDVCKVWQHGGCVGIMDESMSPDEYFCELCRKDLHSVTVGPTGQRSSRYLPVLEKHSSRSSRAPSSSKDPDSKPEMARTIRPPPRSDNGKRRSTMNSRDAAYDENEQFRRAVEASRSETAARVAAKEEAGSRKGKRSRGDSEEWVPSFATSGMADAWGVDRTRQDSVKRRRTSSVTPSSPSNAITHPTSLAAESDDDDGKGSINGVKKIRGAAARNHREKELRDRYKERERADAAGRRKGRAERRRGDESDPSDEYPASRPTSTKDGVEGTSQPPEQAPQAQPDTPPSNAQNATTTSAQRKTGRPPARRGRVGRNQYTRDRDLRADEGDGARERSRSRDGARRDDGNSGNSSNGNGNGSGSGSGNGSGNGASGANGTSTAALQASTNGESGRPSRPRYMHPQRTTMNEMKRRVAAILEFISRTQVELAGETTPPEGTGSLLRQLAEGLPSIMVNGGRGEVGEKEFALLSSTEMMDVLTRKLVLWQQEFGKWGEK
ncbi:MAG: hypothetical protein M1832_005910 [Thelocarpon impressellum]|nr:MAG: hypothetical protein M1832_005910 [Thelocarpon impressellum]